MFVILIYLVICFVQDVKYINCQNSKTDDMVRNNAATVLSPTQMTILYSQISNIPQNESEYFLKYWNLQRNMLLDYGKVMEPCKHDMNWKPYYIERTPYLVTSANYSKATLHLKPAGQYSRLLIEAYSLMNTPKSIGGDSWRVLVKGTASVPVTIIDNMNGSYEASFLILDAGPYFIDLYLEYTLCDGFKDPPLGWFSKGRPILKLL